MTESKFEALWGKTYPATLEEQLKALKTDEELLKFKETTIESPIGSLPITTAA